jgi:hypothetical protein
MPHFLVPLVTGSGGGRGLRVRGREALIATTLETTFRVADDAARLLGRGGLEAGRALVIAPCSVHTAFTRFAIDVALVARDGRVLKVAAEVGPWRVRAALGAFAVVEMAGGSALGGVQRGDVLERVETP